MTYYKNMYGDSPIFAYDLGVSYITISYKYSLESVTYSYETIGYVHVEKMKTLAIRGYGLYHYVQRNVPNYTIY